MEGGGGRRVRGERGREPSRVDNAKMFNRK